MNLKYYEKLTLSVVVFLGVVIFTAYTIGVYTSKLKASNQKQPPRNSITLENINLF